MKHGFSAFCKRSAPACLFLRIYAEKRGSRDDVRHARDHVRESDVFLFVDEIDWYLLFTISAIICGVPSIGSFSAFRFSPFASVPSGWLILGRWGGGKVGLLIEYALCALHFWIFMSAFSFFRLLFLRCFFFDRGTVPQNGFSADVFSA